MKNIFIIESHVGKHHEVHSHFESDILSFTFAPNLSKLIVDDNFSALLPNIVKPIRFNGKVVGIDDLANFVQSYNKIFIGMDLDIEGNAMSKILLDYFTFNGKSNSNVIRIPLTDKGFIAVSNFWDNDVMLKYLMNRQEEMDFIQFSKRVNGSSGVGRRTVLLMNEILNPPKFVENINKDGTSSITYIFKKKIKEQ